MALFYMSANSNTRQLDAQIYFFNLLQCILLVDLSEDNLASNRYVVEKKKSVSMAFSDNYRYSSSNVYQNSMVIF